jgi:hypothetical protein
MSSRSDIGGSISPLQRGGFGSSEVSVSASVPSTDYVDCLGCKLVGVGTLGGIAAYNSYLFSLTPRSARGSRLFYLGFGGAAAALAVYRAIM